MLVLVPCLTAQQPETSGTFILHKFARAIGKETYSIVASGDTYTLTSHFLFTDRNSPVPLETTFTARTEDIAPISYSAKGRSARMIEMQDSIDSKDGALNFTISGKTSSATPAGAWFITDGYSPVAMQEQMMRWWISHGKPAQFTVYPAAAQVHIEPAAEMNVNGRVAHGYTVAGLIWGQECLWMDDAQNLVALISTDAEFDHFEAVRETFEPSLNDFIASAVQSNLAALDRLSASARVAPSRKLAIVGATLEDSTGAAPIPDSIIVIEDGVITAAGARSKVRIPKGATVLDAKGKFAIPGLWDMHAHYEQVEWGPIYLAAGVTTVRDCGNEFDFIRTLHEELDRKQNPAIGPHLEFAGVIDGEGPLTLGAIQATTPEQGVAWVDKYKALGARQIKIYSSITPDVLKAITAEAHKLGLTVTGHIPEGMNAIESLNDGMDQINHIMYESPYFTHPVLGADGKPDRSKPPVLEVDGPRAKELIDTLKAHHTVLDPTMVVFETFFHTKPMSELEPGIAHVAPQLREALDSPPPPLDEVANTEARWQALMATLRELHKAGIPIVAGTDQSIPGYSLHREMEIYVEAGFTPLEALQSATIVSARAMGVEKESGTLETGKRGDIVLLNADPLSDIHNTRMIWRTVATGAVYDPAPLWRSVDFTP
jgi:imidazolonepropionase-like amidohydrolase